MKLLSAKHIVPPGGFKYFVRDTGKWLSAPTWKDLQSVVRAHCSANNLSTGPARMADIEDQLCSSLPPGHCTYEDGTEVSVQRTGLSFREVMAGTAVMADWMGHGMKKVTGIEAARRAGICASCPFNKPIEGCTSCNANNLHKIVERVTGGANAVFSAQLNACYFCGCSNKAQVWLPLEVLHRHLSEELNGRLPEDCWKKRINEDITRESGQPGQPEQAD